MACCVGNMATSVWQLFTAYGNSCTASDTHYSCLWSVYFYIFCSILLGIINFLCLRQIKRTISFFTMHICTYAYISIPIVLTNRAKALYNHYQPYANRNKAPESRNISIQCLLIRFHAIICILIPLLLRFFNRMCTFFLCLFSNILNMGYFNTKIERNLILQIRCYKYIPMSSLFTKIFGSNVFSYFTAPG